MSCCVDLWTKTRCHVTAQHSHPVLKLGNLFQVSLILKFCDPIFLRRKSRHVVGRVREKNSVCRQVRNVWSPTELHCYRYKKKKKSGNRHAQTDLNMLTYTYMYIYIRCLPHCFVNTHKYLIYTILIKMYQKISVKRFLLRVKYQNLMHFSKGVL